MIFISLTVYKMLC